MTAHPHVLTVAGEGNLLAHATEFIFTPAGTERDNPDARHFRVSVSWRGKDTWALVWMGECWNGSAWEYEPLASSRDDDFLERCRFTLEDAARIAAGLPDILRVNGRTFAEWEALRPAAAGD